MAGKSNDDAIGEDVMNGAPNRSTRWFLNYVTFIRLYYKPQFNASSDNADFQLAMLDIFLDFIYFVRC